MCIRDRKRVHSQAALLLVTCSIVAGCRSHEAASTNGLTPLRLQLDWYPQPEHGGFYTAQLLGYYKAEGLDVTLLPLSQYESAATMVTSGKADEMCIRDRVNRA